MADRLGRRDAVAILEDALSRCRDEDMNTAEVEAALQFLEKSAAKKWPFDQFRKALKCRSSDSGVIPEARWQNANAALNGIRKQIGG